MDNRQFIEDYKEAFTPSKLHLISVEDIDTNWLFHTGYVIYDGELIRLHLQ